MTAPLLLSACTTTGAARLSSPKSGGGTAGPIYGPTWPHGVCDTVDSCWPTDGAP